MSEGRRERGKGVSTLMSLLGLFSIGRGSVDGGLFGYVSFVLFCFVWVCLVWFGFCEKERTFFLFGKEKGKNRFSLLGLGRIQGRG